MLRAPTTTIKDIGLKLSTKSKQLFILDPITLVGGHTLAEWDSFILTAREDPEWSEDHGGRYGLEKHSAKWADPEDDGWTVAMSVLGSVNGDTLEFAITEADSDIEAGINRYALDVWGEGGTAGRVQFLIGTIEAPVVWLTMHARARART